MYFNIIKDIDINYSVTSTSLQYLSKNDWNNRNMFPVWGLGNTTL